MSKERRRKAFCSAVARILREERVRRGLSMTRVAALAGLSQQMVSYVERETRVPGLDTLLRIADALDLDVSDVVLRAGRLSGFSGVNPLA
ncbi:MAG TPA: helix-turn-helix transcriptional regulator [Verrucomicrobiota bacterium]|nr:helix-turn-helix transcriptional regulator [Verrucomicrobiota bacterium]